MHIKLYTDMVWLKATWWGPMLPCSSGINVVIVGVGDHYAVSAVQVDLMEFHQFYEYNEMLVNYKLSQSN